MDNSVRATERSNLAHSRCRNCGGSNPHEKCFKQQRTGNRNKKFSSYLNSREPKNKRIKRNNQRPHTCFRCGTEDHYIANCQKPENAEKRVHRNTKDPKTCVLKSKKIDNALEKST